MSNRMRELREDSDLSQKEVAEKLGITQRKYSYVETGTQQLTEEILIGLSKIYNVSTDYILRLTDKK